MTDDGMSGMSNAQKIDNIRTHQTCGWVHPLICQHDQCGAVLEPTEDDGAVVLVCPKPECGYRQNHIPPLAIADPSLYLPPRQVKDNKASPSGGSML